MISNPDQIVDRLRELQRLVRQAVIDSRGSQTLAEVSRNSSADTIYGIDAVIEPIIESFCEEWGRSLPMVVVAEGLEPETGRCFPHGISEDQAAVRIIMDPIDGTRGLMYDKRPAWSLAGAAPNRGAPGRLSDIEVAVMTELPTEKMDQADVLWAVRGKGAAGRRDNLRTGQWAPLAIRPSTAASLAHGFAMISNFFPGTKVLASQLMEDIAGALLGPADVARAALFEDQYISTGGQFYELIVGHDRFNADLRPLFYGMLGLPEGLCCHPYDCAAMLVAQEAGILLTDGLGGALDGPLDVTTGLSWAGFANAALRDQIQPLLRAFLKPAAR